MVRTKGAPTSFYRAAGNSERTFASTVLGQSLFATPLDLTLLAGDSRGLLKPFLTILSQSLVLLSDAVGKVLACGRLVSLFARESVNYQFAVSLFVKTVLDPADRGVRYVGADRKVRNDRELVLEVQISCWALLRSNTLTSTIA